LLNTYGYKVSESAHEWADWARKLMDERETAPNVTGNVRRGWESPQALAARQVAEARAERAVIDARLTAAASAALPPAAVTPPAP
jgi:hypothetical protein